VLLSWQLALFPSGNLLTFDIIGSKAWEIAGNDIVTIGMKKVAPGKTII